MTQVIQFKENGTKNKLNYVNFKILCKLKIYVRKIMFLIYLAFIKLHFFKIILVDMNN